MEPPGVILSVIFNDQRMSLATGPPNAMGDASWMALCEALSSDINLTHFVRKKAIIGLQGNNRGSVKLRPTRDGEIVTYLNLIRFIDDNEIIPCIPLNFTYTVCFLVEDNQLWMTIVAEDALRGHVGRKRPRPFTEDDPTSPKKPRTDFVVPLVERTLLLVQKNATIYGTDDVFWSICSINRRLHSNGVDLLLETSPLARNCATVMPFVILRCRPAADSGITDTDTDPLTQLGKIIDRATASDDYDGYFNRVPFTIFKDEFARIPRLLACVPQHVRSRATRMLQQLLVVSYYRNRKTHDVVPLVLDEDSKITYLTLLDGAGFDWLLTRLSPKDYQNIFTSKLSLVAAVAIVIANLELAQYILHKYRICVAFPLTIYFAFCLARPGIPLRTVICRLLDGGLPFADPFFMEFLVQNNYYDLFDLLLERGQPFFATSLVNKLMEQSQWNRVAVITQKVPTQSVPYKFWDGTLYRMQCQPNGTEEQQFGSLFASFKTAIRALPIAPVQEATNNQVVPPNAPRLVIRPQPAIAPKPAPKTPVPSSVVVLQPSPPKLGPPSAAPKKDVRYQFY